MLQECAEGHIWSLQFKSNRSRANPKTDDFSLLTGLVSPNQEQPKTGDTMFGNG